MCSIIWENRHYVSTDFLCNKVSRVKEFPEHYILYSDVGTIELIRRDLIALLVGILAELLISVEATIKDEGKSTISLGARGNNWVILDVKNKCREFTYSYMTLFLTDAQEILNTLVEAPPG